MEGARFGPSNPAEPTELPQPLLHVPAPPLCPRHRHATARAWRSLLPPPVITRKLHPALHPHSAPDYPGLLRLLGSIFVLPFQKRSYRRCGSGGPGLSCRLPRKMCPVSGDSSHAGGPVVEISSGSEPGQPRRKRWRAGWGAGTPGQPPWPEAHLASPRGLVLIAHPVCWEEPRPGQDAPS